MSADTAVYDASPLIVFHQVGQFDLLRALFDHARVPTEVAREVAPSLGVLPDWVEIHHAITIPTISPSLHPGERAAELLGLDRFAFIRWSGALGIPFIDMTPEELQQDLRTLEAMNRPDSRP